MVFLPLSKHISLPCLQRKTSFSKERPGEPQLSLSRVVFILEEDLSAKTRWPQSVDLHRCSRGLPGCGGGGAKMLEPALLTLGAPRPLLRSGQRELQPLRSPAAHARSPVPTAPARSQTPSHPLALPPGGCLVS